MTDKDLEFQRKLLATFTVEAREHVDALTAGLIALEKAPDSGERAAILETHIREAHSLKGAARAVGRGDVESVCQSLESVFAALKRGQLPPSPGLNDTLHKAVDGLRGLLADTSAVSGAGERLPVSQIIKDLEGLLKGKTAPLETQAALPEEVTRAAPSPLAPETETVRVSTVKLDAVLRQAEELLSVKLAAEQQAVELRELQRKFASWKKQWVARQPVHGTSTQSVDPIGAAVSVLVKQAEQNQQSVNATVDTLLNDMKKVLMQPCSTILEGFLKLIRDLSREQGKEAELVIRGAEIEIDRRILEQMKDPLIHLMRNSIDHGIETPDLRGRKGKQPRGTITIAVSQRNGGNVEILVEDDGAGVDCAKVRAASARLGILSREQAEELSDEEALPLIFHSGVTTSPLITDVSGRGLGLAIAREKAEKLGGGMSVEARPSGGTIFRITLPLTLASFRGIMVQADGRLFAFPTAGVERVVRVNRVDIKTVENREMLALGNDAVPLVRLREILAIPGNAPSAEPPANLPAVVLASAGNRIAVLVDEVIDEQEILVKHLGSQLPRVRNIAGAAVLGTGKMVPVLLVPDLMKSAERTSRAGPKPPAVAVEEEPGRKRSVLVVEDSITSRMLLKNILEGAGYEVGIAVDGIDAFTSLRSGGFDIVVSDVQMPRMNGFDLTAKIRADKKLGEMPVVLVTALESREDRERGIEVGANAYIVKSSFDQSNLLEVIRRLL